VFFEVAWRPVGNKQPLRSFSVERLRREAALSDLLKCGDLLRGKRLTRAHGMRHPISEINIDRAKVKNFHGNSFL